MAKSFKLKIWETCRYLGWNCRSCCHQTWAQMVPFLRVYSLRTVGFIQPPPVPVEAGSPIGNFAFFAVVCRSSAGKRRALSERELVHIVLRWWLQRVGVRVRIDQSLSGGFSRHSRECLLVCFQLLKDLIDPASNHMLILEINPCMSKFTSFHGETANGSLNHSRFLTSHEPTLKTVALPELK